MDSGGGMTGAAAGQRVNGGTDVREGKTCRRKNGNTLDGGRTGTSPPSEIPTRKTQGLTNPSSATEAGEDGHGMQEKADRQPLFAGARG